MSFLKQEHTMVILGVKYDNEKDNSIISPGKQQASKLYTIELQWLEHLRDNEICSRHG